MAQHQSHHSIKVLICVGKQISITHDRNFRFLALLQLTSYMDTVGRRRHKRRRSEKIDRVTVINRQRSMAIFCVGICTIATVFYEKKAQARRIIFRLLPMLRRPCCGSFARMPRTCDLNDLQYEWQMKYKNIYYFRGNFLCLGIKKPKKTRFTQCTCVCPARESQHGPISVEEGGMWQTAPKSTVITCF